MAAAEALSCSARRQDQPRFSGIVESLPMMVGDLAAPGSECATLIDLDPLLITASIAERDIDLVSTGLPVTAQTSTDAILEGIVTFIGSLSDSTTRMYPAEITVPNPDYRIKAGLTTLVTIQAESVMAIVSSGLLT